jgi:hypothetical protein
MNVTSHVQSFRSDLRGKNILVKLHVKFDQTVTRNSKSSEMLQRLMWEKFH